MSAGNPLTDQDRWPWLEAIGREFAKSPEPLIIGCSALKRSYRDMIRHHAGARKHHFMPPALLDSQFAALEPPAPDEDSISIDIDQPLEVIIAQAAQHLSRSQS